MDFKLFDFSIWNDSFDAYPRQDNKQFIIQMFGMNEKGETASIIVKDFCPFFYVKVGNSWNQNTKSGFLKEIKDELRKDSAKQSYKRFVDAGKIDQRKIKETDYIVKEMEKYEKDPNRKSYYEDSIISCRLIKRKKLYGFDGGKEYKFVKLIFKNLTAMNKVKNLWFKGEWGKNRRLNSKKIFMRTITKLYEAKLPPLLRFFHMTDISPTGWIRLLKKKDRSYKNTTCDYNYTVHYRDIKPLCDKEAAIPLKVLSFDIEASSSHGDFPLARKRYEKLAGDILTYWDTYENCDGEDLENIILIAFKRNDEEYVDEENMIHEVFPKRRATQENLKRRISGLLKGKIIQYLNSNKGRGDKFEELCKVLNTHLPELEGDKVTFIGSTFRRLGNTEPYLNHCISLGECSNVDNSVIDSYDTERELILKWVELIQREKPDIIIGYNIFGFDWKFLLERSDENNCRMEFLKLSKIRDCECKRVKKTIQIASGEHNLEYPEIPGIVQVDLYNYFRRGFNWDSYKLDHVSGKLIGDNIKEVIGSESRTKIISSNLMGLKVGNYICFEEIGHCSNMYNGGKKMKVCEIGDQCFYIEGNEVPDMNKTVRWCLAKDDVTPHDIFRLSNEGPDSKAIVAKYCIMDCVLVDILFRKTDIWTGFVETGNICNVPISFIVFRGQGIKLFSFISKKCRERGILMPVLNRDWTDKSGYEGAICFNPKSDFYKEEPVAVVDFGSLYPSSMISENLSHDSKVWTKEFDLEGNPRKNRRGENVMSGEKDNDGNWKYDNLPDYTYVDVEYDLYEYRRTGAKSAAKKIKVGKKICRFAQFPNNEKGVIPSILMELLSARKATRSLIKYKTVKTKDCEYSGLVTKTKNKIIIKLKTGEKESINMDEVVSIEDTYDDFMKNIFDKRQLSYKITANSVYGGCGAKTSDFYDKDIAASTTAIGRLLLTYAEKVIINIYKDRICKTKFGDLKVNADVIYGDTDSCFFKFNLEDLDGNKITGKKALEITIELAQEAGALATKMLKKPHDLEYEKTFYPFCLLSKKRYVGMLYEYDTIKCKRKSMGIVLKRRDNAGVVKEIYGGVIDILMKTGDVVEAVNFVKSCLKKLADGKYSIKKLQITKSLRGFYKNPNQIAHKVLAERMGKRDPGNKPKTGTRIPFAYIVNKGAKLQGDRIETPDFIKKNNLKLDYVHYITNQIMKPLLQLFSLNNIMSEIPNLRRYKIRMLEKKIEGFKAKLEGDKLQAKIDSLKGKLVKEMIFDNILRKLKNSNAGQQDIKSFFQLKK